jgi:hypothetical protein
MKHTLPLCIVSLMVLCMSSCQENYNHYRKLIYGTWDLTAVDKAVPNIPNTLYFKTSTSVLLTEEEKAYEGQYQFYYNVLTLHFAEKQDLYQDWRVISLKDSLMTAVVEYYFTTEGEQEPGTVLEYKKRP